MTTSPIEGLADAAEIVDWLRKDVGMEAIRMILMSGLPGGTRTERVKNQAFAQGCAHAVTMILQAIERGEYRARHQEKNND